MRLVIIALRNLGRQRRRTLLSMLVIASGAAALVLTLAFMRHSFTGLRDAIIFGGLGHMAVMPASTGEAGDALAESPSLRGWEPLRAQIAGLGGMRAVGARVALSGLATHGDRTAAAMIDAVEPGRERAMGFEPRIIAGRWLADGTPVEGAEEAVLGASLARMLGVEAGVVVTLLGVNGEGMLNALDVTVVGTMTTGLADLDSRFVKVHLETAQRLAATDAVSSLTLVFEPGADAARMEGAVLQLVAASFGPGATVVDWQSRAPFYGQVRGLYVGIFIFLGGIVALVTWLATTNTLVMTLMERTRELGTLRAIGTSGRQIVAMVLAESAWLGILSSGAGCLLGITTALAINAAGVKMPPPPGASSPIDLRLILHAGDILATWGALSLTVVLAAALPLVHVLRLRISDALRHS